MLPDIDLQLRTVIKALRDVVMPALEPGNPMAAEQLRVSIATLELVQNRHTMVLPRARRELANAITLARAVEALIACEERLTPMMRDGEALLTDPQAEQLALDAVRLSLMEAISDMARTMPDTPERVAFFRLLLKQAGGQFDLNRAWLVQAGRDPDPAAVPALATLL